MHNTQFPAIEPGKESNTWAAKPRGISKVNIHRLELILKPESSGKAGKENTWCEQEYIPHLRDKQPWAWLDSTMSKYTNISPKTNNK